MQTLPFAKLLKICLHSDILDSHIKLFPKSNIIYLDKGIVKLASIQDVKDWIGTRIDHQQKVGKVNNDVDDVFPYLWTVADFEVLTSNHLVHIWNKFHTLANDEDSSSCN